jgi:hypothetical protein
MRYHAVVPTDCDYKRCAHTAFCPPDCPVATDGTVYRRVRVARADDVPAASDRMIDVAVLDMNHGWPNAGHDSVLAAIQEAACDASEALLDAGLTVRAVSYDVRRTGLVPPASDRRFAVYVGTGGPGHLDPRLNHGIDPNAQGVVEDPRWEAPLFALFDAIGARDDAALLAVCHTFGLMCRWLGVARTEPRGPEKGGKSEGVLENLLTDAGRSHPLFAALSRQIPEGRRLRILDSRIYDLLPLEGADRLVTILGTETIGVGGPPGDAMTMMEVARDAGGSMPRILGVNHHPEIVDRTRLMAMLRTKLERGEVERDWYDHRVKELEGKFSDRNSDAALRTTSEFTFLGPLRFHLTRVMRLRAAALGHPYPSHEDDVLRSLTAAPTLS